MPLFSKPKLKPEEQALFRHAMRDVKPLQTPKKEPAEPPPFKARPLARQVEEPLPVDSFSDHEYLAEVGSEERLEFARPGFPNKLLRQLRRGEERFEAVLDLHGKTVVEARLALHYFLLACREKGKTRVLIIHGKGRGSTKPLLKNKLNHWLRQREWILAFCSAKQKEGGKGAVYVRLKRMRKLK